MNLGILVKVFPGNGRDFYCDNSREIIGVFSDAKILDEGWSKIEIRDPKNTK